jgi:ATP-binding cassette subfamily B protein
MLFKEKIDLNNIYFRYTSDSTWVLKNINLSISKGAVIGIVGKTGVGKSTLIDILVGLLHPTTGKLKIDGIEISPLNIRSWQNCIAHVPQNIYLSDGTVAENIAFGKTKNQIDYEKVRQVAYMAQIGRDIDGWDEKYDTVVGERGIRLSGGQIQRIGIARALYKDASVIILDEATSALDNQTEIEMMRAIQSFGKGHTVIMIAHRRSTLINCSKIIELGNEGIVWSGTYPELLEKPINKLSSI